MSDMLPDSGEGGVVAIVEWRVREDRWDATLALLRETRESTRDYPGCSDYFVVRDPDSEYSITLVSTWASEARYRAYIEWRRDTGTLARFASMLAAAPSTRILERLL